MFLMLKICSFFFFSVCLIFVENWGEKGIAESDVIFKVGSKGPKRVAYKDGQTLEKVLEVIYEEPQSRKYIINNFILPGIKTSFQ